MLFIGGDGVATFDALYCRRDGTPPPYLVVAQNHQVIRLELGRGGSLERKTIEANQRPRYLLVAENTCPWSDYEDTGVAWEPGGE